MAGVGIMVKMDLVDDVVEVVRTSDRIMKIKIVVGRRLVNVCSVYAPQTGSPMEDKERLLLLLYRLVLPL